MLGYLRNIRNTKIGLEYAYTNDASSKYRTSEGENSQSIHMSSQTPPLASEVEIPDENRSTNPFSELRNLVELMIGRNRPKTSLISLYLILTHCYLLFNELPLIWIKISNPYIQYSLEYLFKSLTFSGLVIQNQLKIDDIIDVIRRFAPTLIFNDLTRKQTTKFDILINNVISAENKYINNRLREKSIFCPRVVLSNKEPIGYHNNLRFNIRNIQNRTLRYGKTELGIAHFAIMDFVLNNQDLITNTYEMLMRTKNNLNHIYIPLLSIAKVLCDKSLIEHSDYDEIENVFVFQSGEMKFILSTEDEVILIIDDFFKSGKDKKYKSEYIPLDVICHFIKENSSLNTHITPRALSQFLNITGLVKSNKRIKRSINDDDYKLFGKLQPVSIKINKYKLNKRKNELLM